MVDQRARHGRRMRRLRRAARRWSVLAAALGGATAVLAPYSGLGVIDAFWAAAAGGSLMLAGWRWMDYRDYRDYRDHRALAASAAPAFGPAEPADRAGNRLIAFVAGFPGGREALAELRRQADLIRLRGSVVSSGWRRLDRAAAVLQGLVLRPGRTAETAALEAVAAERELRELAKRAAGIERALRYGGAQASLSQALSALVEQFERGVTGYEELVGAAAAYVAEDERSAPERSSVDRLTDTTELLRGMAIGLAELHQQDVITA